MKTVLDYRLWTIAFGALYNEIGSEKIMRVLYKRYGISDWCVDSDFCTITVTSDDERLLAEFLLRYA